MRSMVFLGLLLGAGTAAAGNWIGATESTAPLQGKNLDQMMRQYPLGPSESLRITQLMRNSRSANFLVQVRTREPLHYHNDSDLTVFVLKGEGTMRLDDKNYAVKAGDTIHIPRGMVHAYINRGPEVSVALVVYSPAPGPNDRVLVDAK